MEKIKVVAIVGPTATGKTELAIKIANQYNGEIINGDAYQIYKGLDIGTAKPNQSELNSAKHHLINIKETSERYSAFQFVQDARKKIIEINRKGKLPIIVGGSGFFIQALLGDRVLSEKNDLNSVPATANKNNRIYDALIIGLNLSNREVLYDNINQRVEKMLEAGLLKEVTELYELTNLDVQSTHAIGYSQFKEYFAGNQSIEKTIELIKRDSRHYAKRQITFFKNQFDDIYWFLPSDNKLIEKKLDQFTI